MEIHLSPQLCHLIPNFKIGVIHYEQIEVGASPQMLKGRLQLFQESIFFELENQNVTEIEEIQEWREIFKKTGKDPNRYRHSAEALFRRIKKQQYLSPINSAIDLNNFFSLQYKIPLGIYNLDQISGEISMRLGEEHEEYYGINGRNNNIQQLIVLADEKGPFGSPFVDSERTAVSAHTKRAIQIVFLRPSMDMAEADKMVHSLMKMFTQIHGGEASYKIIHC